MNRIELGENDDEITLLIFEKIKQNSPHVLKQVEISS